MGGRSGAGARPGQRLGRLGRTGAGRPGTAAQQPAGRLRGEPGAQVAAGGLLVPGGVCGQRHASAPSYGTIGGSGNRLLGDVGAGGAACAPAQGRRRRGRARSRRSRRSTPACTGAEHRSRGFRGAGRGLRPAAIERWHARARAGKGGADPARVRGVLRHGSGASKDGRRPIFWRRGRGRVHGLPCRESNLVVTHLSCLKGGETSNGPLRARQPCPASGAGLSCSVLCVLSQLDLFLCQGCPELRLAILSSGCGAAEEEQ